MVSVITSIIGIVTALIIVVLIRRDHLHVRYGLWWMSAAIVLLLLGLSPAFFDSLAKYLGVSYPPILAMNIGLLIMVIKFMLMVI
jgi:hypothetical protein